ncbi:hypothetical protein HAX54_013946, partial [Datura stramonium]|nr:hypothetical protein [Datura stramonium]
SLPASYVTPADRGSSPAKRRCLVSFAKFLPHIYDTPANRGSQPVKCRFGVGAAQ